MYSTSDAFADLELLIEQAGARIRNCTLARDWNAAAEAARIRMIYLQRVNTIAADSMTEPLRTLLQRTAADDERLRGLMSEQHGMLQQQLRQLHRCSGAGRVYRGNQYD